MHINMTKITFYFSDFTRLDLQIKHVSSAQTHTSSLSLRKGPDDEFDQCCMTKPTIVYYTINFKP